MIGMNMGFKNKLDLAALNYGLCQHFVSRDHRRFARGVIIVKYGVNHSRSMRFGINDQIGHGVRRFIKEGVNKWLKHNRLHFEVDFI